MSRHAEQTLRLTDGGPLTLDGIVQAAENLRRLGAPGDVPIQVRQDGRGPTAGDGWAIVVKWTPDTPPEAGAYVPPEFCGRCGETMTRDPAAPSGWIHLKSSTHPAIKGRPVRDAPQA